MRFLSMMALGALVSSAASAEDFCSDYSTDLFAGQHMLVGSVDVTSDGTNLYVDYVITDSDWYLTQTHLYVGLEGPAKPAPGKFPYKDDGTGSYTVPLADIGAEAGDTLYIAAHGVVESYLGLSDATYDEIAAALPPTATITVAHPGGDSYFNTTVSDGGLLDGVYDGFCIDLDHTISPGAYYDVNVFSSYDTGWESLVDHPENMDLVNYVINQGYVGTTSPGGYGTYTYGDVQKAIWTLIDAGSSTAGLGSWSQARVNEIVDSAWMNGEGFEPGCDDSIAIVLQPVGTDGATDAQITIAQVTLISLGVECEEEYADETAWGFGNTQFDKGWGWLMECTVD